MKRVSIILPCHNEDKNLLSLIPEIIKQIPKKYRYEIICVDDGSSDLTAAAIEKFSKKNKNIKGIIFYRNFGHQSALRAGIEKAQGEITITMDSDFQHPPEIIPKFIRYWEKGFDLVQAKKKDDKTAGVLMKVQRMVGYYLWKKFTGGVISPGVSDFRLFSKEIREYIIQDKENDIFLRGIVNLIAHKGKTIFYTVKARRHGRSSYNTKMFINMFTSGIVSFSTRPLRLASLTGLLIFVIVAIAIGLDIARSIIIGKRIIEGWITAVVLTITVNAILMIYLGILGEYIGVILKEVKDRPSYYIGRTINCK